MKPCRQECRCNGQIPGKLLLADKHPAEKVVPFAVELLVANQVRVLTVSLAGV